MPGCIHFTRPSCQGRVESTDWLAAQKFTLLARHPTFCSPGFVKTSFHLQGTNVRTNAGLFSRMNYECGTLFEYAAKGGRRSVWKG